MNSRGRASYQRPRYEDDSRSSRSRSRPSGRSSHHGSSHHGSSQGRSSRPPREGRAGKPSYNQTLDYPITRKELVDQIYRMITLGHYRYRFLRSTGDLPNLTRRKHFLTHNYQGTACLMVFLKQRHRYYSFTVNRMALNYDPEKLDLEGVRLYPVKMRVAPEIYQGTILDGVLLRGAPGSPKKFIINDAFYLNGKDIRSELLSHKLINLKIFLKSVVRDDPAFNAYQLELNQFHELSEADQLAQEGQSHSQMNGLAFYPERSGTRYLYLYSSSPSQTTFEKKSSRRERTSSPTSVRYSSQPTNSSPKITKKKYIKVADSDPIRDTFEIRKTETLDIFHLYAYQKDTDEEGNKTYQLKFFAMADVPTSQCSLHCQKLLQGRDRALVICEYSPDRRRWVPTEEKVTQTYPTKARAAKKKMQMAN